jgi:hypothetical protein
MTASAMPAKAPSADAVPPQQDAVVDGVNVDAVARAVRACAGVSELAGGRFGEVASYLPGRRVPGVTVLPDAVGIHVKARWGVAARDLYLQITSVLAPVLDRRINVVVADIDDPPILTGSTPTELDAAATAASSAGSLLGGAGVAPSSQLQRPSSFPAAL